MKQYNCKNCGAAIEHNYTHNCRYCGSLIIFDNKDDYEENIHYCTDESNKRSFNFENGSICFMFGHCWVKDFKNNKEYCELCGREKLIPSEIETVICELQADRDLIESKIIELEEINEKKGKYYIMKKKIKAFAIAALVAFASSILANIIGYI